MHAFLITGGNHTLRNAAIQQLLAEWKVGPFDQIKLAPEGPSIGIGQIRNLEKQLWLMPYASPFTVGIIAEAQSLTLEAQQALLKTLEEPPGHVRLILATESYEILTPTIISRCQIINLGGSGNKLSQEGDQIPKTLEKILSGSCGHRLQISETLSPDRETALNWTEHAIARFREALLSAYGLSVFNPRPQLPLTPQKTAGLLRGLLVARRQLLANVNPRLVLDHFFLQNF
ncbi:MAG: hypothetical protein ACOY0S_02845 [Patescibacteria group bacterium]